jgi:hypothetical protein
MSVYVLEIDFCMSYRCTFLPTAALAAMASLDRDAPRIPCARDTSHSTATPQGKLYIHRHEIYLRCSRSPSSALYCCQSELSRCWTRWKQCCPKLIKPAKPPASRERAEKRLLAVHGRQLKRSKGLSAMVHLTTSQKLILDALLRGIRCRRERFYLEVTKSTREWLSLS